MQFESQFQRHSHNRPIHTGHAVSGLSQSETQFGAIFSADFWLTSWYHQQTFGITALTQCSFVIFDSVDQTQQNGWTLLMGCMHRRQTVPWKIYGGKNTPIPVCKKQKRGHDGRDESLLPATSPAEPWSTEQKKRSLCEGECTTNHFGCRTENAFSTPHILLINQAC